MPVESRGDRRNLLCVCDRTYQFVGFAIDISQQLWHFTVFIPSALPHLTNLTVAKKSEWSPRDSPQRRRNHKTSFREQRSVRFDAIFQKLFPMRPSYYADHYVDFRSGKFNRDVFTLFTICLNLFISLRWRRVPSSPPKPTQIEMETFPRSAQLMRHDEKWDLLMFVVSRQWISKIQSNG